MRKVLKYILILTVACGLVVILFSCKGRKVMPPDEPAASRPAASGSDNQIMFAYTYVDACAERMKGNLQSALKKFIACEQLDPANVAVKYELGTLYKLLGDNTKALANAKVCAAAEPMNEWYQLLLIDCYNSAQQYSQAIRVREALVKNFPSRSEFKQDLAIDYAMIGQFDKSFKIYDELERNYGASEQLTLNKVKLLKEQKKTAAIETELWKLVATDKKEGRYYAYLAEHYVEAGKYEKAKQMYDEILRVDPSNPTVHLALHDYYTARGNDTEAFDHLRKAFLNPELDIQTKTSIVGTFYNRAEKTPGPATEQGKELAAIMLQLYPNATESNALYGDFLMLDKKMEESLPYYYRAAVSEKRDPRVWNNLLYAENEVGAYDSLERHSAMAIELFPNQPRNYLFNAVANTQLKRYDKAARALDEGIGFVIDNRGLQLDFLRLSGDARYFLKDYAGSDKAFDEALKIDADNTYVLNNYAYYLAQRGENLDKAEKLARRTLELGPNNRNYLDTYGWVLFKQKKYAEAETQLSRAASMGPPNSTILEHYGDTLYRLNKTDDALAKWKEAGEAGGGSETLQNKIKNKKLDD